MCVAWWWPGGSAITRPRRPGFKCCGRRKPPLKIEQVAETPRLKSWREAYRSFGAKPSEFRSSIEALVRRVLRGDPLPSINALVDIGNVVSLRYLVPAGGHAIDVLTGDITLRPATGREEFTPFGSDKMEHPLPGEVIFAEGNVVLTRRWTWRQANHTLTQLETRAIEFNVPSPLPRSMVVRNPGACFTCSRNWRMCGSPLHKTLWAAKQPLGVNLFFRS
jgi:hypothetical protein